jgi:hypothetical protein
MQHTAEIVQGLVDVGSCANQATKNIAFAFLVRLASEGSIDARVALGELHRAAKNRNRSRSTSRATIGDQIKVKG